MICRPVYVEELRDFDIAVLAAACTADVNGNRDRWPFLAERSGRQHLKSPSHVTSLVLNEQRARRLLSFSSTRFENLTGDKALGPSGVVQGRSDAQRNRSASPVMRTRCRCSLMSGLRSTWMTWVLLLSLWLPLAQGMKESQIRELRYALVDLRDPCFNRRMGSAS